MANPLGAKPKVDTSEFQSGIAAMNRELRVLESGFRASAASLGDWANDATGLESRIKSLNSQMDIQKQKVAATRAEYERIKAEKGENSVAAQNLEIKLNKEVETLGKMESELRDTEGALGEMQEGTDETGESMDELGDATEETSDSLVSFNDVLSGMGSIAAGAVTIVAGLAAAVAAAALAIGGLVFNAAEAAGELVDISTKTGISTTRLQELQYVGDQVGTSLDTITGANARLIRSMSNAQEQSEDYREKIDELMESGLTFEQAVAKAGDSLGSSAQAFAQLGVATRNSDGSLRDSQDVFADVLDALGKIPNEAERDALAMEIFGKSAQELNPLIKAGSDEIARLSDEAHDMGAVMDEENVSALESFGDMLTSLKGGLNGTLGTLAGAFLPGFQDVFEQAGGYLKEFQEIVSGSDGDIGKIAEGLGGLVGKIASDIAEQLPQLLETGLSIIQGILNAIISALPTILPAAVQIIASLVNFIIQALPSLIQAGIQILLTLINTLIQNLPMLIDAALQAVITLATGLAEALPELIPAVVEAIITIVETLIENLPMLLDAAAKLILGLAEGLIKALPVLLKAVPKLIDALLKALLEMLPMLLETAGILIGTLGAGIVENIPVLIDALWDLGTAIGEFLWTYFNDTMPAMGKSLLDGIIQGVTDNWGSFMDQIAKFFQDMMEWILDFLGIASPSKFGIEVGKNLITSIGLGGIYGLSDARRKLEFAMRGLQVEMAGGGNQTNIQNEAYSFWGPVYVSGGAGATMGKALKGRRF